jgi:hypothetical protein
MRRTVSPIHANGARDPVAEYLAILREIYPIAKQAVRVLPREDNRIIVSIPLPTKEKERMQLFDRMSEVATKLLIETDQYIVLSGQ